MNIEVSKHAYEYLDDWKNFNDETSFPEKENFQCMEIWNIWVWKDFTNADHTLEKRLCKDFKIKNLEEFHNFYVQSDKLLLADVFQNFRNMSWNI